MENLPKKYLDFIEMIRVKIYDNDVIIHSHHIKPKCMGGNDIKENLIKISKEDHHLAHLILAECYDKNSKQWCMNIASANLISNIIDVNGDNNPFYGKKHSEESRRKMGKKGDKNPMYNKKHTKETREKMSVLRCGKKHSEETKMKISLNSVGFRDRKHSEETKKLMSYIKKGEGNPMYGKGISIKFIDLEGDEKFFININEASKILGVSSTCIRNSFEKNREVIRGKLKGCRFYKI